MDLLHVLQTPKTPSIFADQKSGIIRIKGKSIPDNSYNVYTPLSEWLNVYLLKPAKTTTVEIYLEYLNTTSSRLLFDFLKTLEAAISKSHKVQVLWYFLEEDEDMLSVGEDYQTALRMDFNCVKLTNQAVNWQ
jgi:hypothetical protein